MKNYFFFTKATLLYILLLFLLFFLIGKFSYKFINTHPVQKIINQEANRNFFNFIFLVKSDENQFMAASIVSYDWSNDYMNVYNIPHYVHLKDKKKENQEIKFMTKEELINALEKLLEIDFDFSISIKKSKWNNLVEQLGGVEIFNDVTKKFPNGRIYIHGENIDKYLNSIENPVLRIDTAFCVAVNLFHSASDYYNVFSDSKKFFVLLWNKLETNIPKKLALTIFSRMVKNHSTLHLNYDRMNLLFKEEGGKNFYVPLNQGKLDANKLKKMIEEFSTLNQSLVRYPINLQVKNTTSVYRLAAKTAGVLRRKRCNVKEYLNSDIDLKKSLILDRCGSSSKREYLKKVTKIKNVYYLIDYRENFDFTLYLGKDYYGISEISR